MKRFVQWFSTAGLGTSRSAAALMFGENWWTDPRWRVLPACIDLTAFRKSADRRLVRAEFCIPDGAVVFGHVGRFVNEKNHQFLIQVAEQLTEAESRARFVLVGAGPTKARAEYEIRRRGLKDRFILLDPRDDIARLMLGVFDFFLFPSLYEGLGLALVEAQAAGLQCFVSTAIPPEGIVIPEMVHKIPLSAGAEAWADLILRKIGSPSPVTQKEALTAVGRSFDIQSNAVQLTEFYREAVS
jgi:glycosyltransferase involved in cell wall biosynthesis